MADQERMAGGELRMAREYLGLTMKELGGLLARDGDNPVREDTIRKWEAGRDPIPYRLWNELEYIEAVTAEVVGNIVGQLNDMRDPVVQIYRTDETFRMAQEHYTKFSARWWRHCVARACAEVPGVTIIDA